MKPIDLLLSLAYIIEIILISCFVRQHHNFLLWEHPKEYSYEISKLSHSLFKCYLPG